MVHEARGLDTVIQTRKKFESCQDSKSIQILETNSNQEIGHVGCAVKWFKYLCKRENIDDSLNKFQQIVK